MLFWEILFYATLSCALIVVLYLVLGLVNSSRSSLSIKAVKSIRSVSPVAVINTPLFINLNTPADTSEGVVEFIQGVKSSWKAALYPHNSFYERFSNFNSFEKCIAVVVILCVLFFVIWVVHKYYRHVVSLVKTGTLGSAVKQRFWFAVINFFSPIRAIIAASWLLLLHYTGVLILGEGVSPLIVYLFLGYALCFWAYILYYRFYVKGGQELSAADTKYLGNLQFKIGVSVLLVFNVLNSDWFETGGPALAEDTPSAAGNSQQTGTRSLSSTGRPTGHSPFNSVQRTFQQSAFWRSVGTIANGLAPNYVTMGQQALDNGAHLPVILGLVATVAATVTLRRFPVRLFSVPSSVVPGVSSAVGISTTVVTTGVVEGSRGHQTDVGSLSQYARPAGYFGRPPYPPIQRPASVSSSTTPPSIFEGPDA